MCEFRGGGRRTEGGQRVGVEEEVETKKEPGMVAEIMSGEQNPETETDVWGKGCYRAVRDKPSGVRMKKRVPAADDLRRRLSPTLNERICEG